MSKVWIVVGLVVVCLIGVGGWMLLGGAKSGAATQPAVNTAKVEKGKLRVTVASTGRVVSNQDVDIKCKASGTVIALPFDVSDEVKVGDVLLQLDTLDQDRAVAKAQAALDASVAQWEQAKQDLVVARQTLITNRMKVAANLLMAQAKLKDATAKLERGRELLAKKLASQEEFDTSETATAAAAAELKTAEAQVEDLKTQELALVLKEQIIKQQQANVAQNTVNLDIQKQQLDYATVRSPINGVVASLSSGKDAAGNIIQTRIGNVVQSGTNSVSGGTTVMTLADLSRVFVYAAVDEASVGQVEVGQPATITADAFRGVMGAGQIFLGRVVRIATKGVNSNNVVTFEVRIEVDSPNRRLLKPEMTTNIEIIKAERDDVLLVPVGAVTMKRREGGSAGWGSGGEATTRESATQAIAMSRPGRSRRSSRGDGPMAAMVTVMKEDGVTEVVDVMLGVTDGANCEVLSGLTEGQTVVLQRGGADSRWRAGGGSGGMRMRSGPGGMPR